MSSRRDGWRTAAVRCLTVLMLGMVAPVQAGLWLEPGDTALRSDIQRLDDAGLLHAPVTTWPIYAPDLVHALDLPEDRDTLPPAVRQALSRVQSRLHGAMQYGLHDPAYQMRVASDPIRVRGFEDTPRQEGEVGTEAAWVGTRFAVKLDASVTNERDAPGEDRASLDGSYAMMAVGNWLITAGAQDRWWGPGWDGSLILGNNARPVPGIAIDRKLSKPFETPWLSWIGPWRLNLFAGRLESERFIPDPYLLTARLTVRPLEGLEIGFSRTAQWGGDGRPQDLKSLVDLALGDDNVGATDPGADEPGNQLGGVDFRWRSPLGELPYAIYGQVIGEDEAGGLPSRSFGMAGVETWGRLESLEANVRLRLEAADTAVEFYQDDVGYNTAYNHHIYRDGYRFHRRSLGHSMDNDGRMVGLGATVLTDAGRNWHAWVKRAELNRDGAGLNTVSDRDVDWWASGVSMEMDVWGGRLGTGLYLDAAEPAGDSRDWSGGVFVDWTHHW